MPCDPNSININIPDGPAGPTIPGFGVSFGLDVPNIFPKLEAPDLSSLFQYLSLLLPVGNLKSPLNPNFGRDIIDQAIKLLDQFLPFLMLYKFFLPILKLILCILEIICALPNPVKTARAVRKLFRECIPFFLNLFPILALLIMIIAIILLLIQLILYIILLILKIIDLLIRNVVALYKAIHDRRNVDAVLTIVKKIGLLLCLFQNLFVVFLMIELILSVIKDILSLTFQIPPCDSSSTSTDNNCCAPDVCPEFLKSVTIENNTGRLWCINQVSAVIDPTFPGIVQTVRSQSFQFLDENQSDQYKQFINMIAAKDLPGPTYPIFYPTDSVYTGSTPPEQAPYTVDVRMWYNPADWNRNLPADGVARFIKFKDCIVIAPTSKTLTDYKNETSDIPSGVLILSGGKGYEDDGTTILHAYDSSVPNQFPIPNVQATLNNFLFTPESTLIPPVTLPNDARQIASITYTFKINYDVLLAKQLTTYGCIPEIAGERVFTNTIFANETNGKILALQNFQFPDVAKARECAFLAIDGLRVTGNLTEDYVKNVFQPTILNCMKTLHDECNTALQNAITIGFDQYKSKITADTTLQFTTLPIKIAVDLKTSDDNPLTKGLGTTAISEDDLATIYATAGLTPTAQQVGDYLAEKIVPTITFGNISKFKYDGEEYFVAEITSEIPGSGQLTVEFDGKVINEIIVPANIDDPRTSQPQTINYQFVYTPATISGAAGIGAGDTSDGIPRRDEKDLSRDGNDYNGE